MMEDIHIPDGIAVKLLLAGLVLASGAVGALGFAPATSQGAADGLADGHSAQLAFPIDNVTLTQVPVGVLSDASAVTRDVGSYALALGQDMDPYALGQDMDPYALALGQDMDPYALALGQDMDPY